MNNEELKPCPFCGGKPEIFKCIGFPNHTEIRCSNRECIGNSIGYSLSGQFFGGDDFGRAKAIQAWNTRKE